MRLHALEARWIAGQWSLIFYVPLHNTVTEKRAVERRSSSQGHIIALDEIAEHWLVAQSIPWLIYLLYFVFKLAYNVTSFFMTFSYVYFLLFLPPFVSLPMFLVYQPTPLHFKSHLFCYPLHLLPQSSSFPLLAVQLFHEVYSQPLPPYIEIRSLEFPLGGEHAVFNFWAWVAFLKTLSSGLINFPVNLIISFLSGWV